MSVHVRMGMVFVLGGFLGWSIKATEPSDAKLLMALPFDGSACAAQAAGNAAPLEEQGLVYGPGVRGQAVEFTRGVRLAYARPGNLRQEEGTVMFWFKPNWSTIGTSNTTMDQQKWRCLFSEPRPDDTRELAGRGTLWLWFWGSLYRGDIGLYKGAFRTADVSMESGVWQHLAFTWSVKGQRLYWNGRLVADGTKSLAQLKGDKGKSFAFDPDKFATFFVGNHKGGEPADGWIDEFKIYDRILSKRQIDAEIAQTLAVKLTITTPYIMPETDSVAWTLQTLDGASDSRGTYRYTIKNADGQSVAQGDVKTGGECRTLHTPLPSGTPGTYRLELCRKEHPEQTALLADTFYVLEPTNRYIGSVGSDLKKTEVVSIHVPDWVGTTNYTDVGKTCIGMLKGQTYMEAGPELHDRFALRLTLPEDQVPYWVEWTYPDDKRRTQEIVMQSAITERDEYMYQAGVFCGDEYPNTGTMQTFKTVYWARGRDVAMIFMTTADGAPAAVGDVRVFRMDSPLPKAKIAKTEPVDGWTRPLGLYFEDPAVMYDFGEADSQMPGFEKTIDKLIAYMKWTGQDFLAYPGVWYDGLIGQDGYNPRSHPKDFIDLILTKFSAQGLFFMPTINLHHIPLPETIQLNPKTCRDGSLYDSPVMIHSTGEPNPEGSHNSPPLFNPLHPLTQKTFDGYVDELLSRYGDNPAFKGIILHLTEHTTPWFGSIRSGYNDYMIGQFEQDTGIRVPVQHDDPLRGKHYYEWLTTHAYDAWVEWRCKKLGEWYLGMAQRIAKKRADLKLGLFTFCPKPYYDAIHDEKNRYGQSGAVLAFNREAGLDPKYYRKANNIILAQTLTPADYRHSERRGSGSFKKAYPEIREHMRNLYYKADTYEMLAGASCPWINLFDFYFEDAVGRVKSGQRAWSVGHAKPLAASWLKETPWRVSTLNPGDDYFLLHFLLPLRYGDVLGFCKGGFLIGTLGMEEQLRAFAAAYRPLPNRIFDDVYGTGQTLTVRSLKDHDTTWFYAVNTGSSDATAKISLDASLKAVTDLATGEILKPVDGTLTVKMSRYQLRSFKAAGEWNLHVEK